MGTAEPYLSSFRSFELKTYDTTKQWILGPDLADTPKTASEWFGYHFPAQAKKYGPAILEMTYEGADQKTRTRPISPNIDFFAGILNRPELGHDLVWHEDTFWFLEPILGYYAATSEEKLELLLSHYMIQCAQEIQESKVDFERVFLTFRRKQQLQEIINRAKAMYQADSEFFRGENGKKRMIQGKILDPLNLPPEEKFIREELAYREGAILFLRDFTRCFEAYCARLNLPMKHRRHLKTASINLIQQHYGVNVRRDLKDETGKYQHGFKNLSVNRSWSLVDVADSASELVSTAAVATARTEPAVCLN